MVGGEAEEPYLTPLSVLGIIFTAFAIIWIFAGVVMAWRLWH